MRAISQFSVHLIRALFLGAVFVISSCGVESNSDYRSLLNEELEEALRLSANGQGLAYFMLPDDISSIPIDPGNPLSPEKIELGKMLFHESEFSTEPRLLLSHKTYSCSSCHHSRAGFTAGRVQGLAEGGLGFGIAGEGRKKHPIYNPDSIDVQPIKVPTIVNTAFQEVMTWDGKFGATGPNVGTAYAWTPNTPKESNNLGFKGSETISIAAINVHRMFHDEAAVTAAGYKELYDEVFAGTPYAGRYDSIPTGLAMAAYQRSVVANEAPFQKWLKGDRSEMTVEELEGAIVFFKDGQCVSCHTGPALNSMEFIGLGMHDLNGPGVFNTNPTDPANRGRGSFTGVAADNYKFKVPTLYNLKDSPFYGHGSSFFTVEDVVRYKNAGIPENDFVPKTQIDERFRPLNLSEEQIQSLVAFIENALHDGNLERYNPESLPSGNCFPNNDEISRQDLGCN